MLRQALGKILEEEPPPDTHVLAVALEHLTEFLTNSQRGDRKEDILSGRPWEDDETGLHYFRLRDLMRYLAREDVRGPDGKRVTRNQVAGWIREFDGEDRMLNLSGDDVRVWCVPAARVRKMPEDETPAPSVPSSTL